MHFAKIFVSVSALASAATAVVKISCGDFGKEVLSIEKPEPSHILKRDCDTAISHLLSDKRDPTYCPTQGQMYIMASIGTCTIVAMWPGLASGTCPDHKVVVDYTRQVLHQCTFNINNRKPEQSYSFLGSTNVAIEVGPPAIFVNVWSRNVFNFPETTVPEGMEKKVDDVVMEDPHDENEEMDSDSDEWRPGPNNPCLIGSNESCLRGRPEIGDK